MAIRQKLVDDNPTVTAFQRELATSHGNIGILLLETRKLDEALAAQEAALAIRQKLADDNPTITAYKTDLAAIHNNIGAILRDTKKPAEALAAYESALAIQQKLVDNNPIVTQFQRDLAWSRNEIGLLLRQTKQPAEALAAWESALALRQKLARDNPTVVEFQRDLSRSQSNMGLILSEMGKPAEAQAAYESAVAVMQKLAREHPESPLFSSDLGFILHNWAKFDLGAIRFQEARVRLREAVEWQRKALAADAANPTYRQLLVGHLNNLVQANRGLGDAEGDAEAQRELDELRDSDPAFAALDAKLAAFVAGDRQPADAAERLTLAHRAYVKTLFATAARLWNEALEANPALGDDRQAQHRYNAACCAALAAAGQGRDVPPPDDAAKAQLRRQALGWLKAELAAWANLLATVDGPQRDHIARTLEHWRQHSDLNAIRNPDALAKLPDNEHEALAEFWTSVAALRGQAAAPQEPKGGP